MNHDDITVTTEGYVLKDENGSYLTFIEQETFGGLKLVAHPVRLAQAHVFPSPWGDKRRLSPVSDAIKRYQGRSLDGTLESIRVVRTSHVTVSEAPVASKAHARGR